MANGNIPVFSGVKAGIERDHLQGSVEIYEPHKIENFVGTKSRLSRVTIMAFQRDTIHPASMVQVPQLPGLVGGMATDLLVGGLTHMAVRKAKK